MLFVTFNFCKIFPVLFYFFHLISTFSLFILPLLTSPSSTLCILVCRCIGDLVVRWWESMITRTWPMHRVSLSREMPNDKNEEELLSSGLLGPMRFCFAGIILSFKNPGDIGDSFVLNHVLLLLSEYLARFVWFDRLAHLVNSGECISTFIYLHFLFISTYF